MAPDNGGLISGTFSTACQECHVDVGDPIEGVLFVVVRTTCAFYLCANCFNSLMMAGIEGGALTGEFVWLDESGMERGVYP